MWKPPSASARRCRRCSCAPSSPTPPPRSSCRRPTPARPGPGGPCADAPAAVGPPLPVLLVRHILPNTLGPLIVQATYVCAAAILTEAILSFLGAGIPTEVPSWGNIMAEGRQSFQIAPWVILFPGLCVAVAVLAINILGDGLRDTLDPRTAPSRGGPPV